MTSFRIRPRFKHLVDGDLASIRDQLTDELEKSKECTGDAMEGHVYVRIPIQDRHFWSPQLHITLEETEDGTIIRGLYGPNPTVWAIFFFGYVALGLLFFFAGMWGLTRWNLGLEADILWALPGLGIAAIALYMVAQMGQKIGSEQMFRLHQFYEETIHTKVHID